MSEKGAQRSGINRAFSWIKKVMEVTQPTDVPDRLSPLVQPTVDLFGWERYAREGGAEDIAAQGTLALNSVLLAAVPEGVLRYVMFASCSHDDPVAGGLELSIQVRIGGLDIGITRPVQILASPSRSGVERAFILQPGEQVLCRSNPAPAAGQRLFVRYRFIDLPVGEYIAPL